MSPSPVQISGAAILATLNRSAGNGSLYLWGNNTYSWRDYLGYWRRGKL